MAFRDMSTNIKGVDPLSSEIFVLFFCLCAPMEASLFSCPYRVTVNTYVCDVCVVVHALLFFTFPCDGLSPFENASPSSKIVFFLGKYV